MKNPQKTCVIFFCNFLVAIRLGLVHILRHQRRGGFGRAAWDICGRSSGVEHNLAKVGVVGSNPIARSNFSREAQKTSVPMECLFFRLVRQTKLAAAIQPQVPILAAEFVSDLPELG
jgi:hypothetical protein